MATKGLENIRTIDQINLTDKRVFMRVDFNVPMKGGKITDDTRIRGAIPTIEYALKHKAKLCLASHLGRPKGEPADREKYSLSAVGDRLSELLKKEVILFDDPFGEGIKGLLSGLKENQVMLLENTRFLPGEEKNAMDVAAHWASFTEVYIDDAFGAIHRAHSSTAALPSLVKEKGIGFLIKKEIEWLDKLLSDIQHPFVAVLGGAKVSDKIGVIENLMDRVDSFIIGGAMAYTFLAAKEVAVGSSLVEKDKVQLAKKLLERFENRKKKLILPIDHVVATALKENVETQITTTPAIGAGLMGLDVGPKTLALIRDEVAKAKTIFWNGPLGAFETKPFDRGTFALANFMVESKAITVVGGGDSVTAVEAAGVAERMTHISTGGGASLEYLEGKKLPGLEILRVKEGAKPFEQDPTEIFE